MTMAYGFHRISNPQRVPKKQGASHRNKGSRDILDVSGETTSVLLARPEVVWQSGKTRRWEDGQE